MRYDHYVIVPQVLKKLFGGKPANVIYHTTCPKCGRQRVDIYRRGQVWQCTKYVPYKEGD